MKEYQIEVVSVTTVYVEANSEDEAISKAYEQSLDVTPDSNEAVIVSVIDLED